jgi:hypothetical protein
MQQEWERGEVRTKFSWRNLKERDHLEDPSVDKRIILGWIFRKWDVRAWTELILIRIGTGGRHFKRGNEPSGSIKCGEFLDSVP